MSNKKTLASSLDMESLPHNVPVLCIPRVYSNMNESHIRRIFNELNIGLLDHIDVISKNNDKGDKFNRVYIHFKRWNQNEQGIYARKRLLNGKEIKIIYDDPWFWKISAYKENYVHYQQKENDVKFRGKDKL